MPGATFRQIMRYWFLQLRTGRIDQELKHEWALFFIVYSSSTEEERRAWWEFLFSGEEVASAR